MYSWIDLQNDAPDIAEFGRKRLDGKLVYLATIKASGNPRVHPVTAFLSEKHCFMFAEPDSTKVKDLSDSGQFHLHCAMSDSSGSSGEFQMSGQAQVCQDSYRQEAEDSCPFRPSSRSVLYELFVEEAIATSYRGGRADRRRWRAELITA